MEKSSLNKQELQTNDDGANDLIFSFVRFAHHTF